MLMQVLYGLHTLAWFSMGTLAVVALLLNYIRRGDEVDAVYLAHHRYMIATFWWTLLWLLLLSPLWLLFFLSRMVGLPDRVAVVSLPLPQGLAAF